MHGGIEQYFSTSQKAHLSLFMRGIGAVRYSFYIERHECMKGIIFVVWEKYLNERFGSKFLELYRQSLGEGTDNLPIIGRTYPDETLVRGLGLANKMSHLSEDRLLFEYGRYFILNELVEYLCGDLLAQAQNGYDLLLLMRDAHAQMRRPSDGTMPPLFSYDVLSQDHNHIILSYDSQRQLCSLLEGAIHGAAERFGEKAHTQELMCMKRGAPVCRMEIRFTGNPRAKRVTPEIIEREKRRLSRQRLANLLLQVLPRNAQNAMDLNGIKLALDQHQGPYFPETYKTQRHPGQLHISQVYTSLTKLHQLGLVASTINSNDDTLLNRRYWLVPTSN